MKHPFASNYELKSNELENVAGATFQISQDIVEANRHKLKELRPGWVSTMAMGEEGGEYPGLLYK
ncbi:hypothetical protein OE749_07620 [Aestuariibacter sp. AA17]|uniref:Uncharacterized protein n=1 Tax=Fluctibacter corallii TaxID=2984329 RepID=A0ABT3A7K6_9ALTE|nr:hypothetical protein [Aestuariibacter sp. AA17]MCV2884559.1 hypothetical protein [Aestuariibacter sp. AA17]